MQRFAKCFGLLESGSSSGVLFSAAVTALLGIAGSANAQVAIYPGLVTSDLFGGGLPGQSINTSPGVSVSSGGFAIADTLSPSFTSAGYKISPTANGASSTVLGNQGGFSTYAYAVNSSGLVGGYLQTDSSYDFTAARWNGSTLTSLSPLATSTSGSYAAFGYALNDSGVLAGDSATYSGSTNLGNRPVVWAAGSSTPMALGIFNTGNDFYSGNNNYNTGAVYSINSSGAMAGVDEKYLPSADGTGGDIGQFAAVWNSSGVIHQLADLPGNGTYLGLAAGDNINTVTVYSSVARVINASGVTAGTISKYDNSQDVPPSSPGAGDEISGNQGDRPVRWLTSSSTPQLLDGVGTTTSNGVTGYTSGSVYSINVGGDVVGAINHYNSSGGSLGSLPALWKAANGTALTSLSLLGTSSTGGSSGTAYGINDAGISVGTVNDYSTNGGDIYGSASGTAVAALWDSSGNVTDLNSVLPGGVVSSSGTTAGWVNLSQADGITDNGYISGLGIYNPGGGGADYTRAFLLLDSSAAVPEPTSAAVLLLGTSILSLRRRRMAATAK